MNLKNAYPGTPDSFHRALEQTCTQIERAPAARRVNPRIALIAALVAALLLASIAYAAINSSVLDWLFSGSAPSQEAQQLVKPVLQSASDQGITLSIDEVLIDGDEWYLGYSIASEREDTVLETVALSTSLQERPTLLDWDAHAMGALGGTVEGVAMPKQRKGVLTPESFTYANLLHKGEPFEVAIKLRVAKPAMPLAIHPAKEPAPGSYGGEVKPAEWAKYKADKRIPVYRHGTTDFPRYLKDADRIDKLGGMKVSEQAGCVQPLTELMLSVTIDPRTAPKQIHARMAERQRLAFDDYALDVTQIELTPTKSHIRFDLILSQPMREQDAPVFDLMSADGQSLLSTPYGLNPSGHDHVIRYRDDAPLTAVPDEIILAPAIIEGEGAARRIVGHDMDRAVTIPLDKKAKDFRVVAKPLPDMQQAMRSFFGEDVGLLKPWKGEGGRLSHASDDLKNFIVWRPDGSFYLTREAHATGSSTLEDDERAARQMLSDVVGIDANQLWLFRVDIMDDNRRDLWFEQRHDGMSMASEVSDWVHVSLESGEVASTQGTSLTTEPIEK